MIHGIDNRYMYAVTQLIVSFIGPDNQTNHTISGTGFFIKKDSDVFLITNRHMVDISYTENDRKYFPGFVLQSVSFDTRQYDSKQEEVVSTRYSFSATSFNIKYALNAEDDIACLCDFKTDVPHMSIPIGIDYHMLATSDFIKKKLSVCDYVAFIGFPAGVIDQRNKMPVLRSGVISSDPRLDYNNNPAYAGHIIAYEAFSTGGASGSPVFALQKGFPTGDNIKAPEDFYREVKLIGINAANIQILGKDANGNDLQPQHQHISLMYKADQILNLINLYEWEIATSV